MDNIPIDPALEGPIVYQDQPGESYGSIEGAQVTIQVPESYPPPNYIYMYNQGPQGDPFAPQPPPVFPPPELMQTVQTSKPVKRKKKPKREEECSFCQGDDMKNKVGEPEQMLTCHVCGRSGHPSCMQLDSGNTEALRSYEWKCIECKTCEICLEKGDDDRILFCDHCDRGWHMDCLDPPIEEPPQGNWFCPQCPHAEQISEDVQYDQEMDEAEPGPILESHRQSSVASSSHSYVAQSKPPKRPRGRPKKTQPAPILDSEPDEIDVRTPPRRGRPPKNQALSHSTRKGKARVIIEESEEEEEAVASSARSKRMKLSISGPVIPRVRLRLAPQKGKGKEREEEEVKGMFDDLLNELERDVSNTSITNADIQRFARSRDISEAKLAASVPPQASYPNMSEPPDTPIAGPSSRPLRSATHHHIPAPTAPSTSPAVSSPGPSSSSPPTLRIRSIRFGPYEIKTWYDAPFPEEYCNIPDGRLWICEFCLKYMKSKFGAVRHRMKCKARHPPGDEIYRDGAVSIFEVDGRKNKIYCQNLCLLSKMYLDHKSLFYDVEPFLFYVITEVDDMGARFVGYFSKEKRSPKDYNVSCIMTLPVRQRQGWGNLLIDFSYLLSKKEKRTGSPEKPLSGLGALGYKNYWTLALMRYLETAPDRPLLEDISAATSMTIEDVHTTLVQQGMIYGRPSTPPPVKPSPGQSIKFPRGRKNGVARRHLQRTKTNEKAPEEAQKGPFVPPTHYEIRWDREQVHEYLQKWEAKGYLTLKPEKLKWSPFFSNQTRKTEAAEATDTDKLAATAASKMAHHQEHVAVAAEALPVPLSGVNGTETPASLFDDDVVIQEVPPPPAPESKRVTEGGPMDVDQPSGQVTKAPFAVQKDDVQGESYTSSGEPTEPPDLFTPPPESAPSHIPTNGLDHFDESQVKENGVLKEIATQKPVKEVLVVPSVPVKRGRGRPKKSEVQKQREQEEAEALQTGGRQLRSTQSKKQTNSPSKKSASPRKRTKQVVSSPEPEPDDVVPEPQPQLLPTASMPASSEPAGKFGGEPCTNSLAPDQHADPTEVPPPEFMRKLDGDPCTKGFPTTPSDQNAGPMLVPENVSEPVPERFDVKLEDLGTPSTVQTSRHSIPSDATVFIDGAGMSKDATDSAEDHVQHAPIPADELGDEDAEGDEDADRRDSTLDSNGSTPFQHQILNQALGQHHLSTATYTARPTEYRLSPGPTPSPIHAQQNGTNHPSTSNTHFTLNSAQNNTSSSPSIKRKLVDAALPQVPKRRREPDDMESFDPEGGGQGAKHWTDEEKTKLFTWLMGTGQDEHWASLRSAKNSCLRECANEVFGGKKTYQALKGCFERNFNLFKQIYAFENFHAQQPNVLEMPDADRLREYEKRLQQARRSGCDVGNITARTIDHWHRIGWYGLFHQRWHGDPQTTKPTGTGRGGHPSNGDDQDPEDEPGVDFSTDTMTGVSPRVTSHVPQPPPPTTNGLSSSSTVDRNHHIPSFVNPQQTLSHSPTTQVINGIHSTNSTTSTTTAIPNLPKTSIPTPTPTIPTIPNTPQMSSPSQAQPIASGSSDNTTVNITLTQGMINSYLQFLQVQTQTSKMKLEYLRRREEREEMESLQRREIERLRAEREAQEYEHNKQNAIIKQRTDKAIELLSNPNVDASVKHSAGEFLKKLFTEN
uniref:Histone acetyltransferase n=1 Tax=Moniliophthora roreri TaxID=221103 RepID=A0A0W0F758_MONRR